MVNDLSFLITLQRVINYLPFIIKYQGLVVTSTISQSTSTSSSAVPIAEYVNSQSQTTSQSPEKPSEIPISPPSINDGSSTSIPTPDPYFTHFDPRMEHQSYKVGLDVKID
jgi:hypothetical protein